MNITDNSINPGKLPELMEWPYHKCRAMEGVFLKKIAIAHYDLYDCHVEIIL